MVGFRFKMVNFSFKMAGFSFKMVDFSFKMVDFPGLETGWRRAEGGGLRDLHPPFWGIDLPHRRSLGGAQQGMGMADAIHWG